jgi:hypothetical protein
MRYAQRRKQCLARCFPTQEFSLLNNEFILRQARFFAGRIAAEAGSDPMAQVERDYQMALGRPLSKEGKDLVNRFPERQRSLGKGVPIRQEGVRPS